MNNLANIYDEKFFAKRNSPVMEIRYILSGNHGSL